MRSLWHNIHIAFKLMRGPTPIMAFFIIAGISFYRFHNLADALIVGAAVMFTASYGFAINEYFDYKKDLHTPQGHLIALGALTRGKALAIACCFLSISIMFTFFIRHPFQVILNIILIVMLSLYSYVNNRYGIFANAIVAICSSIGIVISLNRPEFSLVLCSSLTFFLHIFGREIILDIHDCEADRRIGKTSFPILLTIEKSFVISICFSVGCIIYSTMTGLYFQKLGYAFLMSLTNIVFLVGLLNYRAKMNERSYRQFVLYSRIAFLFSLPAYLV
jgi:4-hydroxybenzoate polyprenyltransferase